MVCPLCGRNISSSGRCSNCAGLRDKTVAAVLTPPPTDPTDHDATTTGFGVGAPRFTSSPPNTAEFDDTPTGSAFLADARSPDAAPTGTPDSETVHPHSPDEPTRVRSADDPPTAIASGPSGRGSADTGPLGIGQAFGPRYHIIRMLGVGGMGAVYQAWDSELGVAVAIKVIRPEVMASPTAAARIESRFKRELLLARQVTHKNVVRIHDLGEIGGIKYITMPYVEGDDLSSILKHDGRLPVPRVLRIARGIVAGLVEAHKAGVVHRDLKPANIMIGADDEAMIMDFGIARSTGGSPAGPMLGAITTVRDLNRALATPDATVFGSVIGTVEYMAPEQAKGITVDQRADVYALGLILYDMLIGQPRAAKLGNALHELQARMEHAPPPVKSVVAEVPDDVDRLVSRCLEPDPAKRYQTTAELAVDLARLDDAGIPIPEPRRYTPRMIAAGVLFVTVLVTGTWWLTRTPPPVKQHDPVSVVIADFQNNTGDPVARSGAGTGAQARARGRRVHQRVRSFADGHARRREPDRSARRRRGTKGCDFRRTGHRRLRRGREAGAGLQDIGQGDSVGGRRSGDHGRHYRGHEGAGDGRRDTAGGAPAQCVR